MHLGLSLCAHSALLARLAHVIPTHEELRFVMLQISIISFVFLSYYVALQHLQLFSWNLWLILCAEVLQMQLIFSQAVCSLFFSVVLNDSSTLALVREARLHR